MKERLVRIKLFGQEFTFYSDAPADEVDEVVELLRQEFETDDRTRLGSVPSSKLLVLGCLRIAARYVRLQREYQAYRRRQDQSIDQLIDRMSELE